MTLEQIYYFKKLAELQHYSKAAAELYISQPSLSYSIKNLEKELGSPLFQRNGRNVVLTKYGKEFYKYVVEVLEKLEDGIAAVRQSIENDYGKISIGTLPVLPGDIVTKSVRSFLDISPDISFDIFTCIDNNDVINGIIEGNYDIGFCFKSKVDSDLTFIPIIKREFVVIARHNHELGQKEKLTLTDLQGIPIITYRESNPLGQYIRNMFKEENISPNIVFSFDEEITISEMVAENLGVAVMTKIPILQNSLTVIPLDLKSDPPFLHLAYHRNSNHSKIIHKFVQHVINLTHL